MNSFNEKDHIELLKKEKHPAILMKMLDLYGIEEKPGPDDNPVIVSWAQEIGGPISSWYKHDSEAWCALCLSICCKRAGLDVPKGFNAIRALSFADWGDKSPKAMLGDVLIFSRKGGGHVGLYVGESDKHYLVLGGNQSDKVGLGWFRKTGLFAKRRTKWKIAQPHNVRQIFINSLEYKNVTTA